MSDPTDAVLTHLIDAHACAVACRPGSGAILQELRVDTLAMLRELQQRRAGASSTGIENLYDHEARPPADIAREVVKRYGSEPHLALTCLKVIRARTNIRDLREVKALYVAAGGHRHEDG